MELPSSSSSARNFTPAGLSARSTASRCKRAFVALRPASLPHSQPVVKNEGILLTDVVVLVHLAVKESFANDEACKRVLEAREFSPLNRSRSSSVTQSFAKKKILPPPRSSSSSSSSASAYDVALLININSQPRTSTRLRASKSSSASILV